MRIYPLEYSTDSPYMPTSMNAWRSYREYKRTKPLHSDEWMFVAHMILFLEFKIGNLNSAVFDSNEPIKHFIYELEYVKPKTWKDRLRNLIRKFLPK